MRFVILTLCLASAASSAAAQPALTPPTHNASTVDLRLHLLTQQRRTLHATRALSIVGTALGAGAMVWGAVLLQRADRDYEGDTCYDCIGNGIGGTLLLTTGIGLGVAGVAGWVVSEAALTRNDREMRVLIAPQPGGGQVGLGFAF